MNPVKTLKLFCGMGLAAAAAVAQGPATPAPAAASRFEGFPGMPARPSARLELRLEGHGAAAALELRGGQPGSPAVIGIAPTAAAAPNLGHGRFGADGTFAVAVDLDAVRSFVSQGFGLAAEFDGRHLMECSNGLEVRVEQPKEPAPPAAPATAADFSLLAIELDSRRDGQVKDQLLERDLVGALGTALNSHGDTLLAKVSGKVMVCVPGTPVQVGGSVAYSAKIARERNDYLVSIGQEVAVLCGVKATKDIGVEGGVSLGGEQIYRFGSPGEVARGLMGIALQQALPMVVDSARGENLARMRQVRQHIQAMVAAVEQLRSRRSFRLPALERALDGALGVFLAVHGRLRRLGDGLERVAGWLVDEAQFVRDHTDGAEVRVAASGGISLKIGEKSCGDRVGAELGGQASGSYQVTVRMFQAYGEEPRKVEVLAAHAMAASFAAGLEAGRLTEGNEAALGRSFEVSQKVTRGVRTVFEREGGGFGTPELTFVIKREFGLLSFGRETSIEFDLAQLGAEARTALSAFGNGEPAAALQTLAQVTAHVSVQDKLTLALKPEFGVENPALTAKVGAELSWADCGPQRQADLSLADVLERLADVEQRAADVRALVRQVRELPELQ